MQDNCRARQYDHAERWWSYDGFGTDPGPELLPTVLAECHRVLAPGCHGLLAFKTGDERRHLDQAYGHELSFDAY